MWSLKKLLHIYILQIKENRLHLQVVYFFKCLYGSPKGFTKAHWHTNQWLAANMQGTTNPTGNNLGLSVLNPQPFGHWTTCSIFWATVASSTSGNCGLVSSLVSSYYNHWSGAFCFVLWYALEGRRQSRWVPLLEGGSVGTWLCVETSSSGDEWRLVTSHQPLNSQNLKHWSMKWQTGWNNVVSFHSKLALPGFCCRQL